MLRAEALGYARKPLPLQLAEQLLHGARCQNPPKLLVPLGDAIADGQQGLG